ncbi:MAG: altronate dehydrogenase [Planctomycetes bacterium]|nr:altronate dehydrogenase [Planctomycetota bacterium]
MSHDPPETVLQFGTGKFLRCFADLFFHEANLTERPCGRVVAVQSTGTARAEAVNARGGCYTVAIRGLHDRRRIDRTVGVESIGRALAAQTDWPQVLDAARSETLRAVVSNTTEAGYALEDEDEPSHGPPRSFPAKLAAVLRTRCEAGRPPLVILPCELLDANAQRLLKLVLQQARAWRFSPETIDWIRSQCCWHNTLVDRIVSAPSPDDPMAGDPLFAVAEPFALWLIEGEPTVPGLVEHPAVQIVDDLGPYHLRKVRILNGAHTALVARAMPAGFQTVRAAIEDSQIRAWLEALLFEEIVPVLESRADGAEAFARATLERFANPFLEHRLADIALHHDVKLQTRLVPTYDEFRRQFGRVPERLHQLVGV